MSAIGKRVPILRFAGCGFKDKAGKTKEGWNRRSAVLRQDGRFLKREFPIAFSTIFLQRLDAGKAFPV
jgi:hypothetical protein